MQKYAQIVQMNVLHALLLLCVNLVMLDTFFIIMAVLINVQIHFISIKEHAQAVFHHV